MSLKVIQIHNNYVNQTWPYIEHFIQSALDKSDSSGDYSIDNIKLRVVENEWQLMIAVDDDEKVHGALVISYFNRPTGRVAFIVAIGGKCIANRDVWSQFENILKLNGATHLEGSGRESILRLWRRFGMTQKYVVTGKIL